MRRCLSDVLKNVQIDIYKEYLNLHRLFYNYEATYYAGRFINATLYGHCSNWFLSFPTFIRKTFINMNDFETQTGLNFYYVGNTKEIDVLISFCEYSYNFAQYLSGLVKVEYGGIRGDFAKFYVEQVLSVVEKLGYIPNIRDGITDFVPKNPAAIAVAEIIEEDLSYDVIEYNHHSMRGDLLAKKATLVRFANLLEPNRTVLESVNKELSSNIFFMFNNMDLRHNNSTVGDRYYKPFVGQMSKEELETWYDELYQMCLLAFLELDNIERTERVKELKVNF